MKMVRDFNFYLYFTTYSFHHIWGYRITFLMCSVVCVDVVHKDGVISIMSRIKLEVVTAFSHSELLKSTVPLAWLIGKVADTGTVWSQQSQISL